MQYQDFPPSFEEPFTHWPLQGLFGAPAILHPCIDSTNSWVRSHCASLAPGTIVVADCQTAGRGRFSRRWESPGGQNLYFTLFLQPCADSRFFPQLTQLAALSLNRYGLSRGWNLQLKWPNDVLWQKRKICGILSELVQVRQKPYLILGMGINVNMDDSSLQAIDRPAACLRQVANQRLERLPILQGFLQYFAEDLEVFTKYGMAPFVQSWQKFDGFLGSRARLIQEKTRIGTIAGLQEDGSLLFRTDDGIIHQVYSGDLEI